MRYHLKGFFVVLFLLHFTATHASIQGKIDSLSMHQSSIEFVQKLVKEGFEITQNSKDTILLKGKVERKNCTISIVGIKEIKKIELQYPEEPSWNSVKKLYYKLMEPYKKRFGGGKAIHEFTPPFFDGDGYEMYSLSHNKCIYQTTWIAKDKTITVKMTSNKSAAVEWVN